MKTNSKQGNIVCPCQNNDQNTHEEHKHTPYSDCCYLIHQDIDKATTAEALMRARYSAYTLLNETFLINSWHPETRPNSIAFEPQIKWTGLTIQNKEDGQINDDSGEVEFIARCKINGKASRIHEISRFRRHNGHWLYLDGKII